MIIAQPATRAKEHPLPPQILLLELHLMFLQQRNQFIAKRNPHVMAHLVLHVPNHGRTI
jgi:hypothetical protein